MAHRWHFFRAGAVDQVSLRDGDDVLALDQLDQKLWVALAMPVKEIDVDPATLELLDANKDGRIRVQDILSAVAEVKAGFKRPTDVLQAATEVKLDAIADAKVLAAAKRMLSDLGKKEATSITIEDTTAITKAFADTVLNGDGIVIPASTDDAALRTVIDDAIAAVGSVVDRSGKPGIDTALAEQFFGDIDKQAAWLTARGTTADLTAAADAFAAVRAKLEDFFTRCRLAAFDPRAQAVLAGQEADLIALAAQTLDAGNDAIAALPLAKIETTVRLPLRTGINPAWVARIDTLVEKAVTPLLGPRDLLIPADVAQLADKLAAFETWRGAKPVTKVGGLAPERIAELAKPEPRAQLAALIAADAKLAAEYEQITSVAKVVRYQRDLGRILRNFVNFSDFYGKRDGVFQAGTLYIDGRALHLCVPVADVSKHGALATSADTCLIYCEIKRDGVTRQIAAALTNGDPDNIFVGRNGIFYDREDKDWDASVTKIISNPISIREAFWSPYKKLVKTIEDGVTRRAQAAEAAANAKMEAAGKEAANADKVALTVGTAAAEGAPAPEAVVAAPVAAAAPAAPPPVAPIVPTPGKIDLGAIAAIGVAIGGIGTLVGVLLATLFGLGKWLPLGVVALLLLISGPSMLLAWLKLRRRNLGPILDANGWAINGRARINVSFGAAMTELAEIPKGSQRSLSDPFADKRRPWKLYIFLIVLVVLAGTWYIGRLDEYLPEVARSTEVLGSAAPASKKAEKAEKDAAKATEPAKPAAEPAKPK